jgi:hypothetical protein
MIDLRNRIFILPAKRREAAQRPLGLRGGVSRAHYGSKALPWSALCLSMMAAVRLHRIMIEASLVFIVMVKSYPQATAFLPSKLTHPRLASELDTRSPGVDKFYGSAFLYIKKGKAAKPLKYIGAFRQFLSEFRQYQSQFRQNT